MQLKLKWRNPNTVPVSVSIYRNDTAVPVAELGAPLVTLPGTTLEWIDKTVLLGKTYFYRWKVTLDTQVVYSEPYSTNTSPYTGPGPSKLVAGTNALGYFGVTSWTELFTAEEITNLTGMPLSPNNAVPVHWNKWIRNGKILFMPQQNLGSIGSPSIAYNAGMMFGTDDNGAYLPPLVTVPRNQRTVITKGFHNFIIRMPTGLDDRSGVLGVAPVGGPTPLQRRYSEFSDIMMPTCDVPLSVAQRMPTLANPFSGTQIANGLSRLCCCQEKQMIDTTTYGVMVGAQFAGTYNVSGMYPPAAITSQTIQYMPVLELIPNDILEVTL